MVLRSRVSDICRAVSSVAFLNSGCLIVISATSVIVTLSPHCWAVALTWLIVMVSPMGGTPSDSGAKGSGRRLYRVAV